MRNSPRGSLGYFLNRLLNRLILDHGLKLRDLLFIGLIDGSYDVLEILGLIHTPYVIGDPIPEVIPRPTLHQEGLIVWFDKNRFGIRQAIRPPRKS